MAYKRIIKGFSITNLTFKIMQKKLLMSGVLFLALAIFLSFSTKVFAITPTLSLSGTGDGDSVQINVTGDPNSSVLLFYTKSGAGQQMPPIGTTNANGIFTTTISSSGYGVAAGSSVYVTTGGISGPQSASVAWPAVASLLSSSNMLSLSQTGLVLSIAQSSTITASNLNGSSLYLSSNSNPQIANFNINGSQITVLANSYGSTTGTFCLISNNSNCGSVYVIVQNSNVQPLTFSQSSVTLSSGQNVAVQISGGSGSYSVFNNASQNSGVVQTSISGGTITLTTTSTTGSSSITICSVSMTSCGIINVTIGNAANSLAVSFSQSNPTLVVTQSLNVSIFGPTSSLFYVASNSNPSVVQANLSGSTLTLLGIANGSSVISVCAAANNCGSLNITVNSNSTSGGRLLLSQDSMNLSIGQTGSITISGGTMPYSILSNGSNLVQLSLNSNILTLYGLSSGTSLINICSSSGNCSTLSIIVNGPNSASLPAGCFSTMGYSQTTGMSCSLIPTTTVNTPTDCTGALYSVSTGQACPVSTVMNTPTITPITAVTPAPTTETAFKFTKSIKLGSSGTEVSELQKKLKTLGFYNGKIDGGFGSVTEKAVKAFQKAHKLSQVGNVGPQTRTLLNK